MRTLVRGVVFGSAALTLFYVAIGSSFGLAAVFTFRGVQIQPFDLLLVGAAVTFLPHWRARALARLSNPGRIGVIAGVAYLVYQLFVLLPYAVLAEGVEATTALRLMAPRLLVGLALFFVLIGFRYVKPRALVVLWNATGVIVVAYALYKLTRYGVTTYASGSMLRLRMLAGMAVPVIGWLVVVSPLLPGGRRWVSLYLLPAIGVLGLVLVNHRGAYVALVVVAAVFVALRVRRTSKVLRLVAVAAVLALAVFAVLYVQPREVRDSASYSLRTALDPYSDRTATNRIDTAPVALTFFHDHPFGDSIWDRAIEEGGYERLGLPGPENFVLEILIREGVVGLVFWCILIGAAFFTARRNRRRDSISEAMLFYLIFHLAFCLTNGAFYGLGPLCLMMTAIALVFSRDAALIRAQRFRSAKAGADMEKPLDCVSPSTAVAVNQRRVVQERRT